MLRQTLLGLTNCYIGKIYRYSIQLFCGRKDEKEHQMAWFRLQIDTFRGKIGKNN